MRDPRAPKRRRVSEETNKDDDGDINKDGDGLYSAPSSPEAAVSDSDEEYRAPRGSASHRRSTRGKKTKTPNELEQNESYREEEAETPSRAGARSSGRRQRKAPQRYEGDGGTPSSTRKTNATPRSGRPRRSTQKARQDTEDAEMDVDQSPQPTVSATRTRSRRGTAGPKSNGAYETSTQDHSPSPEEYNDGLDDLVAMQIQQDLQTNQGPSEVAEVVEPIPEYVERLQALVQSGLHDEVRLLTMVLLEKLSGKRQIPLKGVETEYNKVSHLIEQTVTVGEGNSMLLLGSRGSGKTAMVETIISSLAKDHANEFHVVRLNGFLHTDDRLALREMWRQLGRETNTEDDTAKVSSYADTMATLLALLSHPEELFGASGNKEGVTAAKSIVILLDEFDLFVTHPRQTLLYNLFDIAQARKAPIAVIGLTTKVDVTEMLEKRVKSRFSHRYVYVPLPKTYETFSSICMGSLDLDEDEVLQLAETLGSEGAMLKSHGWKTLLDGWKHYLKVILHTIHSDHLKLTSRSRNSGKTKTSNSISSKSTTRPNQ